MKERWTIGWTGIFLSLVLALGLGLLLAWVLLPHTIAGANPIELGAAPGQPAPLRAADTPTEPYLILAKNEDYYGAAGVVVTQVTALFIGSDEAWTRYQSGELDTITPPDDELATIKASPVYSPQLHVYPAAITDYYGFSCDVPPLDNATLRGALSSAIDRRRLISETLSGDEFPALTFTPPRYFGHVDGYAAVIGRPFSPTLAASLLAASGYTGTPTITLMVNTSRLNQSVAEAVRQMWVETLGVTVTVEDLPWSQYIDLLQNGSADERPGVFRMGWRSDYPDAHNWLKGGFDYGGRLTRYESPAYDALVAAAGSETVSATRLSLYEQAEARLVMTDTAIAPLYYWVQHRLTRPDLVRTYRSFGGQHLDEWSFTGDVRPLEIAWRSPSTLDPALASDPVSMDYVDQLFLGLTDFDAETGAVEPELATDWEVSPDGLVYTFTLRSDVTWTDGVTVTAGDVEYGVLRSLDPATGSGYAYVLYIIENAEDYNQGNITDPDLVGVEALDATHARFTLADPAAYFPVIAGLPPARPQPQWAIDTHGDGWTDAGNIVTNGPYKLAAWEQAPYLRIQKEADGDPMAGGNFVFTIKYWNDSGASAESTVITDSMVGGLTYISDTSPFTHTGSGNGPIVWYLDTLSAHSSGQFDVHVQVTASASETITNTAQIATSNPYDQGDSGEKESQWIGHVEGPWMFVNYGDDHAGGNYAPGHTFWITVTDSGGTPQAWATATTEPVGGGPDGNWGDGFTVEGGDWSPSAPDIRPGDRVHFRSDDGYSNTVRVGTITGAIHAEADTVSGAIEVPWLASQAIDVIVGGWGFPGFEVDTVDLDATGKGAYFVDFSPTDLPPDISIGVTYLEPDADRVYNGIDVMWQVYLPVVLQNCTP